MVEAIKGNAPPPDVTKGSPNASMWKHFPPTTEGGVPLPRPRDAAGGGAGDVPRATRDNNGINNNVPKTDGAERPDGGKGNRTDQPKLDIFGKFRRVE